MRYTDGNFTVATISQEPVISFIDPNNFGTVYRYTYTQNALDFRRQHTPTAWSAGGVPLGMRDPRNAGAYLVESSEPQSIGNGVLKWTRDFMTIPKTRTVSERFPATYQFTEDGSSISEINLTVNARVTYSYFHAPTLTAVENIPLTKAYRLVMIGSTLNAIGTAPAEDAPWVLAEDETLTRIRGHMYEKRSVLMPKLTPEEFE